MKEALVILTGIHYSNAVADTAIDWAAKHGVPLRVVFIEAGREKHEGYGFPSDYSRAEHITNTDDAEKDDQAVVRDYEKLLQDMAREKQVSATTSMLTAPSMNEILSLTKEASLVFVDANYDPNDPLSPHGFTIDKLKKGSSAPVMVVQEDD
jgi:hypothetical protein